LLFFEDWGIKYYLFQKEAISMKSTLLKICIFSLCLVLLFPAQSKAAKESRLALIIGNSSYQSGPLKNPVNDATDMAAMLKKLGFTVILKKNANLEEMEGAIEDFGNRLKRGGVGLFYYAGHGLQVGGVNYLVPIGAKINKESDVKYKTFDAGRIIDEMANANNGLNIVILDACRDNPFSRSFRNATRGLAIISNAPSGTFISYSTGANQVARDGEGRNSPYTKALLENIDRPGLSINDVFMKVRSRVKKESGQIPWELSSLEGNFYFIPGSIDSKSTATDKLDEENRKLKEEQRRLEAEKAELEQKLRSEGDKRLAPSQAKAPEAFNDWVHFAGQWYGRWSNNLGESGDDSLVLKEDQNGNISGVWTNEVPVSGRRINGNTVELQGWTATRSYQMTVIATGNEITMQYTATRLNSSGSYRGTARLFRR
jgi:hypothetical protein